MEEGGRREGGERDVILTNEPDAVTSQPEFQQSDISPGRKLSLRSCLVSADDSWTTRNRHNALRLLIFPVSADKCDTSRLP